MERLASIAALPVREAVAIIINCGTKWVTTLALVSTLRHSHLPVVVVDSGSRDNSREHFANLARRHGLRFYWTEWPLRSHPANLDRLFRQIRADEVLLVDSDIELVGEALVDDMRAALASNPQAYGAGFLHGPMWMGGDHQLAPFTGWYVERMWIPFVLLRSDAVRRILDDGGTFATARRFDVSVWPARILGSRVQSRLPVQVARWRRPSSSTSPPPAVVEYDTGALLHEALGRSGWRFAPLDEGRWSEVRHFHGVTRLVHGGRLRRMLVARRLFPATRLDGSPTHLEARRRLREDYGIDC